MVTVRSTDVEPVTDRYAGIYSPSEVASYLLVTMPAEQHPPTRRRILRWIRHGLVAPERHSQSGRDVVLDFGDLVTCQAITILGEARFGLSDIVEAERASPSDSALPDRSPIAPSGTLGGISPGGLVVGSSPVTRLVRLPGSSSHGG